MNTCIALDQEFENKLNHYGEVQQELGLDSVWSMFEVDNLSDRHPYVGVTKVVYAGTETAINGGTWAALYVAANACIRDSGDEHHVFIEGFDQYGETLLLITGS